MKDNFMSVQLIFLIHELCRKEFTVLNPGHEEMIAFPEIEIKNLFVWNPFELTLRRIDQLAAELGGDKDKDIPIVALELGEHQ